MRIMGLDYGSKTVGVAISDALRLTAQAVETIERKEENKLRRTCARIEELIKKSMEFGEMLKRRTGLEVILWDERLTTVEAERILIESNVRRENRKKHIDQIAAVFILQGYLDLMHMKKQAE